MEIRFRPNSVNPDVDDRLLDPSMARIAHNLRLGASTSDTDLGITLFNNLRELPYQIPGGENQVTGIDNDFETQTIFFSLWNSGGNHGIYQVKDSVVTPIISGAWLNFQRDGEVSITAIDGKIYWTDNFNPPRMLNVAKAIAGLYPSSPQDWMFTQIKRPGAIPPVVEGFSGTIDAATWALNYASVDYNNVSNQQFLSIPYQFSYYYVYDNFEESVLAPISTPCYYAKDVVVRIPGSELSDYIRDANLIIRVVFVYRIGVDGVWYVLKSIDNPGNGSATIDTFSVPIPDLSLLPKNAVPTNITNRDFDSVPIRSKCNAIAVNRLMHSNYEEGYNRPTGITLSATPIRASTSFEDNPDAIREWQVHKPGGLYNVGLGLLDEYGRRVGIIQNVEVQIPTYENYSVQQSLVDQTERRLLAQTRDKDRNSYHIEYQAFGIAPEWCKYIQVMESNAIGVDSVQRMSTFCLYWYIGDDNQDYLSRFYMGESFSQLSRIPEDSERIFALKSAVTLSHAGYCVFVPSNCPFQVSSEEEAFVTFIGASVWKNSTEFPSIQPDSAIMYNFEENGNGLQYRVAKKVDNKLFVRLNRDLLYGSDAEYNNPESNVKNGMGSNVRVFTGARQDNIFPVTWWEIEVFKRVSPDQFFYQNSNIFQVQPGSSFSFSGILKGDYYINQAKKLFSPVSVPFITDYASTSVENFNLDYLVYIDSGVAGASPTSGWNFYGAYISANPSNIYDQNYNPYQGQTSVVVETQRATRLSNWITYSDPIILGSEINGLSKFNSVDKEQMPAENGPITAIVPTNAQQGQPGVMLAVGTLGIQSVYLQALQQTGSDGDSVVSLSTKVLGTNRPLIGQFGASQLKSISVMPKGTVYWWSEVVNDWIRYAQDGLNRLGLNEGSPKYSFSNLIRTTFDGSDAFITVYDQLTDEAIVIAKGKPAFVYSERYKAFNGLREISLETQSGAITPERAASLAIRHYYFLQGRVWESEPQSLGNSLFGQRKVPRLDIVAVGDLGMQKRWSGVEVWGPRPSQLVVSSEVVQGGNSQQTSLVDTEFTSRKDTFQAAIKCDENSNGGKMNGRPMESRILKCNFVFNPQQFDKLNLIAVKFVPAIVQ